MGGKLISVLLPTRGRGWECVNTIMSVYNNTDDKSNIEFIIRVDNDDINNLNIINDEIKNISNISYKIIIGPRLRGYESLNEYYNEMFKLSVGKWVFFINDDCIVESSGVDKMVLPFGDSIKILNHEINGVCYDTFFFPIVNRKIIEVMGHVSKSTYYDGYLNEIGKTLNIKDYIPLKITHLVDKFDDLTKKEKEETHHRIKGVFETLINERNVDVEKIKKILD